MSTFYHVSRNDISKMASIEKTLIDHEYWYVEKQGSFKKEEYIAYLTELFPLGITNHGTNYMLSRWPNFIDASGNSFVGDNHALEAIFEMVRMFKFSNIMSRFVAVFGCNSIEDARTIRDTTFRGKGTIYQVECDNFFEADMRLLHTGHFFASALIFADKYWSGMKSDNPFAEILMAPPIKIIHVVE